MSVSVLEGDCLALLRAMPSASFQCCVTSPPYWGLRDYGAEGQMGLEQTPDEYVEGMVGVFREVRRVLRDDGTLWLNVGDSYSRAPAKGGSGPGGKNLMAYGDAYASALASKLGSSDGNVGRGARPGPRLRIEGLKPKDLVGIPWMLAFALRADGWWLRKDIIWHKPNAMPESATDRPTSAHEHVFLMSKSDRYFYDADAIREPDSGQDHARNVVTPPDRSGGHLGSDKGIRTAVGRNGMGRNARDVWTIATQPFSADGVLGWDEDHDHYAVMPPDLAERCIKAGSATGDTVLDPFGGAGTTGLVADRLGRSAVLCELNPKNVRLARARIVGDAPLLVAMAPAVAL